MEIISGEQPVFAGLFGPSLRDLEKIANRPGVERVISCAAVRAEFGGSEAFYAACPDYLVAAHAGYVFRGVNVGSRIVHPVALPEDSLPPFTSLPGGDGLTDVADLVLRALGD